MVGNGEKIGHHAIVLLQHQQQSLWFCSDINKMAFVFIRHQQHGFYFVPMSTTWLSKLTTAGKARVTSIIVSCPSRLTIISPPRKQKKHCTAMCYINQISTRGQIGGETDCLTRQGNDRIKNETKKGLEMCKTNLEICFDQSLILRYNNLFWEYFSN